jgi:hypothetical protein
MPNISIRGVDQPTVDELKRIAASNGRSMQAELRILLGHFASLPWESRLADCPVSMLPLPRWYTELSEIRLNFAGLSLDRLPARRSPFRSLPESISSLLQDTRTVVPAKEECAA